MKEQYVVFDAFVRGLNPDTERIVVYTRDFEGNVHVFEEPIVSEHVFFREQREITPFSMTKPSEYHRSRLYHAVKEEFPEIEFTNVGASGRYFILAEGKRCELSMLPPQFKIGGGSLSPNQWLMHQLKIPLGLLTRRDGKLVADGQLSWDELPYTTYAFDTEWLGWEDEVDLETLVISEQEIRDYLRRQGYSDLEGLTKQELVKHSNHHFTQAIKSGEIRESPMTLQLAHREGETVVVDYFQYLSGEDSEFEQVLSSGKTLIRTHKAKDVVDMIKQFQNYIDENNCCVFITQNGMTYDFLKTRDFVEKLSKEGYDVAPFTIGGEGIVNSSSKGFFSRVECATAIITDFAPYSQHHISTSKDNRFETVLSNVLNRRIEKRQDYDDLTRQWVEMFMGREESGEELMKYGSEDVTELLEAADFIMSSTFLLGRIYGRKQAEICATSKKAIAKTHHKKERVLKMEASPWNKELENRYKKATFGSGRLFNELAGDLKTTRGVFDSAVLCYMPFFSMMYFQRLLKDPRIRSLSHFLRDKGTQETDTQNALLREVLMYGLEEGYMLPRLLFREEHPAEDVLEHFNHLVDEFDVIDYKGNFYLFENADGLMSELRGLGVPLAQGSAMSFAKGKFVLSNGVNYYKQGIDVKGIYGWRTLYQRDLIRDIVGLALEDCPEAALVHVSNWFRDLRSGSLDKRLLIYFKQMSRDFWDYSYRSQGHENVRAFIRFGLRKGEKFAKVKIPEEWEGEGWMDLSTYLELPHDTAFSEDFVECTIDDYLGPLDGEKRKLKKGGIGLYLVPLAAYMEERGMPEEELVDMLENGRFTYNFPLGI